MSETKKTLTIKEKLNAYIETQPQIGELLSKLEILWRRYGFKIKLVVAIFGILTVIILAVSIGRNLAALNKPSEVSPAAIPTIEPGPEEKRASVFSGLKNEISQFRTLLPDPAPPAVDANITLLPPER